MTSNLTILDVMKNDGAIPKFMIDLEDLKGQYKISVANIDRYWNTLYRLLKQISNTNIITEIKHKEYDLNYDIMISRIGPQRRSRHSKGYTSKFSYGECITLFSDPKIVDDMIEYIPVKNRVEYSQRLQDIYDSCFKIKQTIKNYNILVNGPTISTSVPLDLKEVELILPMPSKFSTQKILMEEMTLENGKLMFKAAENISFTPTKGYIVLGHNNNYVEVIGLLQQDWQFFNAKLQALSSNIINFNKELESAIFDLQKKYAYIFVADALDDKRSI